jgi:Na+-transporting NADH:ubiquinone oxidoreductase subunit A
MTYGARALHALPDAVERTLLGWAVPRFGTWSFHKAFLKGFLPSGPQDLRPGLYGGHRAIVPIGHYGDVVATPDIYPAFLFKSMFAGDLEASIELGMLDLSVEEAALCSFICPSKIDFCGLLDEGLARYEQEA